VTLPLEHAELATEEIQREPVAFVAAPQHPAARRRLTLGALAQEAIIHHEANSVTRAEVEAVFRRRGLTPQVAMEVSSPEAMKQLVLLGLGVAPFSRSQVAAELKAGRLVRLRVAGFRCWRRSGVIRRREGPALRAVSAFLAMLPRQVGRRAARRP
jgi:DNA-binding transcriptional LysR family regulator